MSWTRFFHRKRWDEERARELEAYLEIETDENIARGMSPEEARHAAHRKLGNTTLIREEIYLMNSLGWLETLWQDLRFTVRMLRRSPGFTAVAVITLALGIGANTAIFSLLHDAILQRLPIHHPEELVQLAWQDRRASGSNFNWPDYQPLLEPQPALPGLFAYLDRAASIRSGSVAERVRVQQVSGAYFSTLGVPASLGRVLDTTDDGPGAAPAAMLSYAYWQRRFALSPAVLGETLYLEGTPLSVVGVEPPTFYGLDRLSPPDIICPLHAVPLPDGTSYYVYFFARLAPGASVEAARDKVSTRFHALLENELKSQRSWMERAKLDVRHAATGEHGARLELGSPLGVLGVLAGIVLLICCANLASLLVARATGRSREIAVRLALGASRWRVIRQLLTESVLLGMGGGCLGLAVGSWVHRLLMVLLQINPSGDLQFSLNVPLLAFTAGVSVITGIVFGIAPALRVTRAGLQSTMRGGAPSSGPMRLRPTRTFLVLQVAASVVLLVCAALFVRTLRNLQEVDTGFESNHLLLLTIDPRATRFQGNRLTNLFDELIERAMGVPGVRSAALAEEPLFGVSAEKQVWVQSEVASGDAVTYNTVGPGFFRTAGIPVEIGREFTARDRLDAPLVAVVNEAFARQYFPGQNPLGQRFGDTGPASADKYEIVGVVRDTRSINLRLPVRPAIFQSLWQSSQYPPFVMHIRITGDPDAMSATLRREIQGIDPGLVIYGVRSMSDQVNGTLRLERTFATLCALFGTLVLGLCCVGLYGVSSYSVTQRTNEIGLRMAVGAAQTDVVWLFVRETLTLFAAGVALGTPVALACAQLIKNQLFGLRPSDPSSIIVALLTLATVATAAALLPARRAAKVDPMVALRYE